MGLVGLIKNNADQLLFVRKGGEYKKKITANNN